MQSLKKLVGALSALVVFGTTFPAWASPFGLTYGGRLTKSDGSPITGTVTLSVSFYDAHQDGNKLGPTFSIPNVVPQGGVFSIHIPASDSQLNDLMSSTASPWIQVRDETNKVDYDRQLFTAVPYALKVPIDPDVLKYDTSGRLTLSAPPENGKFLSAAGGSLQWVTAPASGSGISDQSNATAVTIDSQEHVGIGTTNPFYGRLHVNVGTDQNFVFRSGGPGPTARIEAVNDAVNVNVPMEFVATNFTFVGGGNVGIGTDNPSAIGSGFSPKIMQVHNSGTAAHSYSTAVLTSASTAPGVIGSLMFGTTGISGAEKRTAQIVNYKTDSSTTLPKGNLRFDTSDGSTLSTRMTISDDGNVGIGTTSPANQLHINAPATTPSGTFGSFNGLLRLSNSNQNTGWLMMEKTGSGAGAWNMSILDSGALILNEVNVAAGRMTWAAGGNIGIGTTVPSAPLEIVTPAAGGYALTLTGNNSSIPTGITFNDTAASNYPTFYQALDHRTSLTNYADGTALEFITYNPTTTHYHWPLLMKMDRLTDDSIVEFNKYTTGVSRIGLNAQTAASNAGISVTNTGAGDFLDVGAGKFRVNASGNIGVGTATPAATLDVNGFLKLKKNSSAPIACNATQDGSVGMTSTYRFCACKNGTGWVYTSDGTTACVW